MFLVFWGWVKKGIFADTIKRMVSTCFENRKSLNTGQMVVKNVSKIESKYVDIVPAELTA